MKYNYRLAGVFGIFAFMGTWGFGNDWRTASGIGVVIGLTVLSLSIFVVNIEQSRQP